MNSPSQAPPPSATNPPAAKPFQWRALISVLVALCFLMLAVTGIVLFISPPGRVANWTNWSILGLRKSEWGGVHIWFGLLFLVVSVWHLALNWRPMLNYFKNRRQRSFGLRKEWLVACGIVVGIFIGTKAGLAPFSSLLAWNESVKQSWEQPQTRAPIPHAELLTLRELAAMAGTDVPVALVRLEAKGVKGATGDTVVAEIADQAKVPAARVYEIIASNLAKAGAGGHGAGGGASAGGGGAGGPGNKTLVQFCADEGIEIAVAQERLAAKGFKAEASQTLRELAVAHGFARPFELIEIIRATAE
jgi:hypothetical protein